MKYQGLSGTVYDVDEKKLAGGGEGNVYAIIGNDKQVAKVFKVNKREPWREEKLRLMMQEKLSEEQMRQITWPQDVIYSDGEFAGYVMPKLVHTSSLTELYTEEKYDLRFRLLAAINLCVAVNTVHQMGQVCGDLNPQNISVNLDKNDKENGFKITLVDADSYHFTADGTTYRCEVGLGDYIAPELQNKMAAGYDLKTVPLPSYTKETDLFALAVHIFCLLMNGCHPFVCAKDTSPSESNIGQMTAGKVEDSIVCPQLIDNIKNGFFPFYEKREGTVIPVYAPEFVSLPDEIQTMFVRTFVDGYSEPLRRVTASEWEQALLQLAGRVQQCSKVASEYYFDHVPECPLCKVRDRLIGGGGKPDIIDIIDPPNDWGVPPKDDTKSKDKVKLYDRLPLKYKIGSILMFICAGIAIFYFVIYLCESTGVSDGAIDILLEFFSSHFHMFSEAELLFMISVEVFMHIGLLLRKTKMRGIKGLVFYCILLGIALSGQVINFSNNYLYWHISDDLDYGVLVAGEFIAVFLLIMKCYDWKRVRLNIYNGENSVREAR